MRSIEAACLKILFCFDFRFLYIFLRLLHTLFQLRHLSRPYPAYFPNSTNTHALIHPHRIKRFIS